MAEPLRVLHYINTFFGGLGGEEEAHTAVSLQDGALGPGRLLEQILADEGQVIATVMCGDGYFSEHEEAVVAQVQGYLRDLQPDIFLAGPAFRSGRYGLACGRLCLEAEGLGIPAITSSGGGVADKAHSLDEWYEPVNAWLGPQGLLLTSLALVGVEGGPKPLLPRR